MKQYAGLKACAVLAALAIMGVGGVAEADYLIILRNGKEIKVPRYEEQGDHIVYKRYGGKISISKTRVEAIKDLNTGQKRVFGGSHTAQEPKATPRVTRPPARKSPAKPASAQEPLWGGLQEKAGVLVLQGRYAEGVNVLKEALKVAENTFGPNHPRVATTLNRLAYMYQAQGKYAEAEPLLKRVLAIEEKALGPNHPNLASSLHNLAELYRVQGKYAEVEPLIKRTLTIREKALGPNHPLVAVSLVYLTAVYDSQGRYAEAEPLVKRALPILEKALGPDHPAVADMLESMAELYEKTGRNDEAKRLEARAKAIRSRNQ